MTSSPFRLSKLLTTSVIVTSALAFAIVLASCGTSHETERSNAETASNVETVSVVDGFAVADISNLSHQATFFPYDADGTALEFLALRASDDSVRLALNTCQVCNGSSKAYFVQEGDALVCQSCKNRFYADDVGVEAGGCNPVPLPSEAYELDDATVSVSTKYLDGVAPNFENWKRS